MLRQRVVTAVILLAILGAVLAAPGPLPFAILVAVFAIAGLFEWWRLTLARAVAGAEAGAVAGRRGLLAVLLQDDTGWRVGLRVFTTALAFWLFARLLLDYALLGQVLRELYQAAAAGALEVGSAGWNIAMHAFFSRMWVWALFGWIAVVIYLFFARTDKPPFSLLLTAFGLLAVPAACTALLAAHGRGVPYLLSLLAVVWAADIGAYFVGRKLGGRKLAPHISPGKTLSGAIGGMVAAVLWIVVSAVAGDPDPARTTHSTFGADLAATWTLPGAVVIGALLGWLSVAGDLFESLLKRRAGRKDSSNLLPGHGGVLDRIDAVLPVVPLAMLLVP